MRFSPLSIDSQKFLKLIEKKEKIFVLGGGSNTLITDKTYDGVVIKLSNNFNNKDALNFANKVAGISTTRSGAANAMPDIKEVEIY